MRSETTLFTVLILSVCLIATGCNDDDDNNNPSAQIVYPVVLEFDRTIDQEFRMWTAGAEISTSGMDPADYVNSDDYAQMSDAYLSGEGNLIFTEDSLVNDDIPGVESMTYYFSNDSLFIETNSAFLGDLFLGTGDLNELTYTQSYYNFCYVYPNNPGMSSCNTQLSRADHNLESVLEEYEEFNNLSDISDTDTLLIYKQKVVMTRQM